MIAPTLQLFLAMIVAGAGAALGWQAMSWLFLTIIHAIESAAKPAA